MPWRDKSGPNGAGPLTGRGMGDCPGAANVNYGMGRGRGIVAGRGRGCGRGMARGFGRGLGFFQTDARTSLQREKEMLQNRLNQIENDLKGQE